jgi:hypothetical protein
MTAEILNLNRARKAKERAAAQTKAAENRATFGRTKGEKAKDAGAKSKLAGHLDGHKLDDTQ